MISILTKNSRTNTEMISEQLANEMSTETQSPITRPLNNKLMESSHVFSTVSTKFINSLQIFSINDLNLSKLVFILTKNADQNDCLRNCSGNGFCKNVQNNKYICECFENFAGPTCQINLLPCSSNPCLNNGTCINQLENKTFFCKCCLGKNQSILYYGKNCEKKIDLCTNETCSKHGICYESDYETKCKCFNGYLGQKCEKESNDIKIRKFVIKTSTIIAILTIFSFYIICLVCDYFTLKSESAEKKVKKSKKKFKG